MLIQKLVIESLYLVYDYFSFMFCCHKFREKHTFKSKITKLNCRKFMKHKNFGKAVCYIQISYR